MWWFEVDRPSLVLGSAQPEASVDLEQCAQAGVEVVRRRSGGGSVLMIPDEIVWVDIVIPADDPLVDADVGRSMWWVGDLWSRALTSLGVEGVEVHRGPLQSTAWSRLVCFDGVGPGEVLVEGRKAVGVSQRRTRSWSRIQTAVHRQWRGGLVESLIRDTGAKEGPATPWVLATAVTPSDLRSALVDALGAW